MFKEKNGEILQMKQFNQLWFQIYLFLLKVI